MFGFKTEESIALYVPLEENTSGKVYFSEPWEWGTGSWAAVHWESLCVRPCECVLGGFLSLCGPTSYFRLWNLKPEQSVKWEAHVSILEFTLHRIWVSAQTFVETCSLFFIKSCPLLTFMTCFLTWTQKETVFHTVTSRGILSCNMKQNAHGICDWTTKAVISRWGIS